MLCASFAALAVVAMSADGAFAGVNDPIGGVGVVLGKRPNPAADVIHTTTDKSGNFSFANLPAGEYVLIIKPVELQKQKIGEQSAKLDMTANIPGERAIPKVVDIKQAYSGIAITVPAGGTVSGHLYEIQVVVPNPGPTAAPGAAPSRR